MTADKRTAYPVEASFPKWGNPIATAIVKGKEVEVHWTPELRELLQALYTRTGGVFDNEYEQEIIRHGREASEVRGHDDVSRISGRIDDVERTSQSEVSALRIALDAIESADAENEDLRERVLRLESLTQELGGVIIAQQNDLSQFGMLGQALDRIQVSLVEQGRQNRRDLDDVSGELRGRVADLGGALEAIASNSSPERIARELVNQDVEGQSFSTDAASIDEDGIETTGLTVTGSFDIPADSIGTVEIEDGAVTNLKIGADAVQNNNIQDGAVTRFKLATSAVATGQINNAAVTLVKLNSGIQAQLNQIDGAAHVDANLADLAASPTVEAISTTVNALLAALRDNHSLIATS